MRGDRAGDGRAGNRFYARLFARWLASQQGYRPWPASTIAAPANPCAGRKRGAPARSMTGWGRTTTPSSSRCIVQHPGLPLFAIGHSFGGQCAPLLPSRRLLAGLVNIAVGSGAMRHNTPAIRRTAPLLWYVLVPVLCPLFGYFPGARLGVIGDLPTAARCGNGGAGACRPTTCSAPNRPRARPTPARHSRCWR